MNELQKSLIKHNSPGYIIANIAPTGSRSVHLTNCPKIRWAENQSRSISEVRITENLLTWYKICKSCVRQLGVESLTC